MEEEIRALLLSSPGITDVVGQNINWGAMPQGSGYPSVVLNVVSDTNEHTMSGPDRLIDARVQADIYAETYGEAKAGGKAIRALLDGYSGGNMQGIFHEGSRDSGRNSGSEIDLPYRVSSDYMTKWRASNG